MTPLRPGLLDGSSIALSGELPLEVGQLLSSLGATIHVCEGVDEDATLAWAESAGPIDALVCSACSLASVEEGWSAVRAVANGALIPAGSGAIVLLAPWREAVEHASAVRAAVENLARTLSVEWARYGITTTAVVPGVRTAVEQIATLVAFLCSHAGGYYSGCRFELGPVSG